jgi:murein DD-endopeptidase MepM/ murein hydrolase activator NlpD
MEVVLGRRPIRVPAAGGLVLPRPLRSQASVESGSAAALTIRDRIGHETPLRIQGRVGSAFIKAPRRRRPPRRSKPSSERSSPDRHRQRRADDRFDIILEHRRAETGETETGQLLYAGLDRSAGKDLQLMQWEQGGKLQWFEAAGVGRTSGTLQRPVPGMVSSNFGLRRHPILGYTRLHKGMDFRAGYGTPILAATDGRVSAAGWAGGYGRQVRIHHSGGLMTSYSHMSRIAAQPGSFVRQGQVIGYVGSTGLSTGPHLHYELYRNGAPINPASVKFVMRAQLSDGAWRASARGCAASVDLGGARARTFSRHRQRARPARSAR